MENRKKILFFLFGGVGGAERMTLNFGKMLPRERFETVFVICGRASGIEQFIPSGYVVERIPWLNIHVFPRLRILRKIRLHRPDYVFSSVMQLNVLLLSAASFARVPCVVRNDNMLQYVSGGMRRRIANWYPRALHVVAQTEEMKAELDALIGTDTVVCLHNMLDVENITRCLEDVSNPYGQGQNYLCVANFLPSKGHDILLAAFVKLRESNRAAQLYLVGGSTDPAYEHFFRIKGIVDSLGLTDCVHFMGFQKNPYVWMKYADCLVLPSRIEGLPNVLLESMYLGTPVVSTVSVPVVDRMVSDGVNGYKVAVGDIDGLAEAMKNAVKLSDVKLTFEGATSGDIEKLFEC